MKLKRDREGREIEERERKKRKLVREKRGKEKIEARNERDGRGTNKGMLKPCLNTPTTLPH